MKRFNAALRMVRTNQCYMQNRAMESAIRIQNIKLDHSYGTEFTAQALSSGNWYPCALEDLEVRK